MAQQFQLLFVPYFVPYFVMLVLYLKDFELITFLFGPLS